MSLAPSPTDPPPLPTEDGYCAARFAERDRSLAWLSLSVCLVFHAASLLVDPIYATEALNRGILVGSHLLVLGTFVAWMVGARDSRRSVVPLTFATGYVTTLTYAVLFYLDITRLGRLQAMKSWTGVAILWAFALLLAPTHRVKIALLVATALALPALATWAAAGEPMMVLTALVGAVATGGFKAKIVLDARRQVRLEYVSLSAKARAERERRESELSMARAIQDSVLPPPHATHDGLRIDCLLRRHHSVGGDWYSYRAEPGPRILVAVADAAGKGLQAALVTHGIHSLWTSASASENLDVAAWLTSVNATLRRMGQRSLHAATVGVLEWRPGQLTYWSAGHPPAFAIVGTGAGRTVRKLYASGSMLGVNETITLHPRSLALRPAPVAFLLGSDGVFPRGGGHAADELLALDEAAAAGDADWLARSDVEDDKVLVRLAQPGAAA